MLQGLTGWHFLALLVIILLIFGAARLPALARSLGQSARVFKGEMKEMKKDDEAAAASNTAASNTAAGTAAAPTPTTPAAGVVSEPAPRRSDTGDHTA